MTPNPLNIIQSPVVWICDTTPFNSEEQIHQWIHLVRAERQAKIKKYKYTKDQALSLAAGLMLETGLKYYKQTSSADDTNLVYNEYGKPYLKDNSLYFNLSHSEYQVMAIFAKTEVGCDIEFISEADDLIVNKYFSKEEKELYYQSDKEIRNQIFFRIWTLREAFLKTVGTGLFEPEPECSVVSCDGLFVPIITYNHRHFIGQSDIYQNYAFAWWIER